MTQSMTRLIWATLAVALVLYYMLRVYAPGNDPYYNDPYENAHRAMKVPPQRSPRG